MTPPVLLLHGWGGSFASTWSRYGWTRALGEAGLAVIETDLPGHGSLAASRDPEAYADLAAAVGRALPDGPVDVIGYSLGAKIALALAARRPGQVRRMVIAGLGDNLFAPEPSGELLAAAMEQSLRPETPAPIAALVRYANDSGGDPQALAAVLRRPPNPVLAEANLAGLRQVLLVNGEADRVAMPDIRLRRALRADYLLLPGVDHLSIPPHPEFQSAALSYLRKPD